MYRVSVLQFEPSLLNKAENIDKVRQTLTNLETDLVVLPELCTSGYVFANKEEIEPLAEKLPEGEFFLAMRELSQRQDFSIVYGFAEKADGKLYNSSALVNPDGSYHVYRKTHLFYREKLFFSPGDTGFGVYPAKGGVPVGMMICFDWQFPESARTLALKGAEIIAHPSNLVLPWCQDAMRTRSLENRVFSITANRIGTETSGNISHTFTGQSQILGTRGEILAKLPVDQSELVTIFINPMNAQDKDLNGQNNLFADRRPELYTV